MGDSRVEITEVSAEKFLRDKYKLVDFAGLTINGKPFTELMDEYAGSFARVILSWKKEEQIWHEELSSLRLEVERLTKELDATTAALDLRKEDCEKAWKKLSEKDEVIIEKNEILSASFTYLKGLFEAVLMHSPDFSKTESGKQIQEFINNHIK